MLAPNGLKKRHIFERRLKIFSNERTGNLDAKNEKDGMD